MLGNWIRPWRGEALCGLVIAVSGEELICRAPGGFEFRVLIAYVKAGMVDVHPPGFKQRKRTRGASRAYRLTAKGVGEQ